MAECIVENENDLIAGIEGGHAVRRTHNIELWDEEFDTRLGFMSADSTVNAINSAIRLYNQGFKHGTEYGKRCQQEVIRRAIGLDS